MTSIDKASWSETNQFLQNLGSGGLALESLQKVNQQPDLAKAMVAALRPTQPTIAWPGLLDAHDRYFGKVARWNTTRRWGLGTELLNELEYQMAEAIQGNVRHEGLYPLSLELWLGRDLAYNWNEAMACLSDGVRALGYDWCEYFDTSQLSFRSDYTPPGRGLLSWSASTWPATGTVRKIWCPTM